MPGKKRQSNDNPPPPASPDAGARDLVSMYAKLVQTLENAYGRDDLAQKLVDARDAGRAGADAPPSAPAVARAFRRLGMMTPRDDAEAHVGDTVRRMADAVSRDRRQIALILDLFAGGDAGNSVKAVCGATPLCLACSLTRDCQYFNNPRKPEMAHLPPAARLMAGNEQALSDAELLAVVMHGEKATGLEEEVGTLVSRYGRLRAVFRADANEFLALRDMGRAQALRLAAAGALHRRLLAERRDAMLHISAASDIYDRYAAELREYRVEAAVLLMLDQQHNVIRDAWFCDGSPNMAQVGIADLLRPAIREYACRVALIHNHPSDNPTPSTADHDFTRRLRSACDILGLVLVDHVIVTESGYYSFSENGSLGL